MKSTLLTSTLTLTIISIGDACSFWIVAFLQRVLSSVSTVCSQTRMDGWMDGWMKDGWIRMEEILFLFLRSIYGSLFYIYAFYYSLTAYLFFVHDSLMF